MNIDVYKRQVLRTGKRNMGSSCSGSHPGNHEYGCHCKKRQHNADVYKRQILVVDHYVPTFDRDAGSKTTYHYLKMFLKKGYVVKFLGDNFLHEEPYTTCLLYTSK